MKRLELITSEEYISTYLEQKIVSGHSVKTMRADVAKFVKDLVDEIVSPSPGEAEAVELMMFDEITGDREEVASMEDAVKYVKDCYVEGNSMHPDFSSFPIYAKIGEVFVEEDDKGNAIRITSKQLFPGKVRKEVGDRPIYPLSAQGLDDMLTDFLHDHLKENGYSTGSEHDYDKLSKEQKLRKDTVIEIIESGTAAPQAAGEKMREAAKEIMWLKTPGKLDYNPKYEGYFEALKEALSQPPGNDEWVKGMPDYCEWLSDQVKDLERIEGEVVRVRGIHKGAVSIKFKSGNSYIVSINKPSRVTTD